MPQLLEKKSWESKSSLKNHLDTYGPRTLLIGKAKEASRAYYSVSVRYENIHVEIGLIVRTSEWSRSLFR